MSTTPLVYKYPYDPTGINPSNLVAAEKHTIPREETRAFATLAGPFYTESLVVKDAILDKNCTTDFFTSYL